MVPWYLFKRHAEKSIQSAMQRFTTSDQAKGARARLARGGGMPLAECGNSAGSMQNLSWRILKHSTFTQKAVLAVQLPSSYTGAPSAFHPQAYNNWSTYAPPTYVAPPAASQDLYQPPSDPPKEPVYPPPPREPADAGIPTGQQPGHL